MVLEKRDMITDLKMLDSNKIYSYADYLTWRFEERIEIIKGRIFEMCPAPSTHHQRVSLRLLREISNFLKGKKCEVFAAPFDVRLPDRKKSSNDNQVFTVVQPDICIICDSEKLDERGCIGSPDLIIEIISKSTKNRDLNDKFKLYEEAGVPEYWIVHPNDATVSVFELKKGKYLFRKMYGDEEMIKVGIFDNFEFDLKDVFY